MVPSADCRRVGNSRVRDRMVQRVVLPRRTGTPFAPVLPGSLPAQRVGISGLAVLHAITGKEGEIKMIELLESLSIPLSLKIETRERGMRRYRVVMAYESSSYARRYERKRFFTRDRKSTRLNSSHV